MTISKKQRGWILGAALLLTVAATASVNKQDDAAIAVVRHATANVDGRRQNSEPAAIAETSAENLVEKLKRPALPETVKDMFPAKSWYVPPPPVVVQVRPSAPPLSFQYIGKMVDADNHAAVFLEKQRRIFIVREGDAIDGNYRVDAIAPPLMTLIYIPLDEKQTMQIGEVN